MKSKKEVPIARRAQKATPIKFKRKLYFNKGTMSRESNKMVLTEAKTISDLDGTSELTTKEAYRILDKIRGQER
jgi:hypothetical protein